MSQRADRRTLSLQLLPMSVLDPPPVGEAILATWGAMAETTTVSLPSLCLCPGEVGELLIRLDHRGDRPLEYQLQVNGNIPQTWYTLRTEGSELQRGREIEAVVRFCPEPSFFEAHQALQPEESLSLSYQGEVRVYECSQDGQVGELLASEPFHLFLRPRSLYPQFLPAVYREIDFIGRFLAIFEQSFEPAVQTLQALWAYLDPLTAPEALLPFLAQWVGWKNEANWSIAQQRSLIRRAMQIYRWRGTRRGLQLYLHLYTGLPLHDLTRDPDQQPIQIHEAFQRGFVLGESTLGPTAILGGGKPFHFSVKLCPLVGQYLDESLVRTIIEQEKPAFCTYDLEIFRLEAPIAEANMMEEPVHV
ncbi:MAG: phage tail protein [Stenomitos frigidus ULC029]